MESFSEINFAKTSIPYARMVEVAADNGERAIANNPAVLFGIQIPKDVCGFLKNAQALSHVLFTSLTRAILTTGLFRCRSANAAAFARFVYILAKCSPSR